MSGNPGLKLRQDAGAKASKRMLDALLGFTPADKLTVGDVKFIAEWCRTVTFDAIRDVDAAENRS